MKKSLKILIYLILLLQIKSAIGQTSYMITTDQIYLNASNSLYKSVKPGDTLYFAAGNKNYLLIKGFRGAPGKPIVMINSGGPIIIDTDFYYGINIQDCQYIKFTGTGDPGQTYGFQVKRVAAGAGMSIGALSSDFEIDHVSIENTLIGGLYAKTDPECDLTAVRSAFTQYNTIIHDNYIGHAGNEGMYIGSTKFSGQDVICNGKDTLLMPSLLDGVKVYNNLVEYSGWDGIQVSSAYKNCQIYNNKVLFDSQAGVDSQMSGIIMGGGTRGDCFNNFISQGKGDGIECHGLGGCRIFNNIIVDAGRSFMPTDPTKMKHGMFFTDVSIQKDSSFFIQNNNIINPKSDGIRFSSINSKNNLIASNVIINPGSYDYYQNGNTSFKGINSYVMMQDNTSDVKLQNNYLSRSADSVKFVSTTMQAPDDFNLLDGSPLIDHADIDPAITFDFEGAPRPSGVKSDIGAFEFQGTTTIVTNVLPDIQNITGGGSFCDGGNGVAVGLAGSQTGISYQLAVNGSNIGNSVTGTGSAIDFGLQIAAGTYTVTGTNMISFLSSMMAGSTDIILNSLPIQFTVTGGGAYCDGGGGVNVGLSGSQSGIEYLLILNGTATGNSIAGTGNALDFGLQTAAGIYSIIATNASSACTNVMIGDVTVAISALAVTPAAIGGITSVCAGSITTLTEITTGGTWSSSLPSIASVTSTGSVTGITPGIATIFYTVTNAGGCSSIASTILTVNALPSLFSVTGGGVYCTGGTGVVVGLNGSQSGVNYQLLLAGVNTGATVAGTGSVISFGLKTTAGSYTVIATNSLTTCSSMMTGSVIISTSTAPAAPASINGTKSVCVGNTTTLTDATAGGIWSSSNAAIATVGTTGSVKGIAAGTVTITYTVTNAGGCSSSTSTAVTVNALPASPATIGGNTVICQGTTTTLTEATTGGVWSTSSSSIATVTTKGVVTGIAGGTATIRYTVTNASGCTNNISTTVTVNSSAAQPDKFTVSTTKVSKGTPNLAYTVPLVAGVTYKWNYSGTGATISGTTNSVLISFSLTATSGTLSVTATNGCGTSASRTLGISLVKGATIPAAVIDTVTVQATVLTPADSSEVASVLVTKESLNVTAANNDLKVYPNPTINNATFEFQIGVNSNVKLDIYSMTGQQIARIFDADVEGGITQTAYLRQSLPSGLYSCVMRWGGKMLTKKLIVMQ